MSTKQLIVVISAFAVIVLLYCLPTKSSSEVVSGANREQVLNQKIDEALNIIQTQPAPMPGIKLLKEVLEEDPKNVRALELMSGFTIKTGQYEKAVTYLERLAEVQPSQEVMQQLGGTYLALKDTLKAKQVFAKLYESVKDSTQKREVQEIIKQLK
jgi:predicted Zn-dependent protease